MSSPREAPRRETATVILDVAERLFAEHGFDGVSLRDITGEAGVALNLVTYHFKTKDNLLLAVFERRAGIIGTLRLDALAAVYDPAAGKVASVEELVRAFLVPLLELVAGDVPGWRSYARLVALVAHGGVGVSHPQVPLLYDDVARKYLEAFAAALPGADRDALDLAYYFLVGAMLTTYAQGGRLTALTAGRLNSDDFSRIHDHLVPFVSAGFRALGAPRSK